MPRSIGIVTAADSRERSQGQLHVYDGEGKGKSQAALGVVLRTIGLGICEQRRTRVLLLRFLKGPGRAYDEDAAIEALQQGFPHLIDHLRTGRADHFTAEESTRFDREEAERGWVIAKGAIASALYSVVVLDELNLSWISDCWTSKTWFKPWGTVRKGWRSSPRSCCTGTLIREADLHSETGPSSTWLDDDRVILLTMSSGIEIYTGEGKGNQPVRSAKHSRRSASISQDKSHRVLILQWLKGTGYTEDAAIAALRESYPHLVDHLRSGRDAIVWRGQQEPIDYVEAERAWEIARAAISSGLYKTVILDELNPTVDLELLPVEPIVQTLLRKPSETEVIITGRCKTPPAYFDLASIHSEMVCHKHYAEQGVDLKRGVDY